MLRIDHIEVHYNGVPAIHDVSFQVREGELVTILGANGVGKSTILKTVMGTLHPVRGKIEFKGEEINHRITAEIVKKGITYIPEGRRIFGPLSVEENLHLGAYVIKDRDKIRRDLTYVYQLFPRLRERRRQKAGTLSGGEQQMLAIARGLMANPTLLMLDEPSLGLMPKLVTEVLEMVRRLKEEGHTILLVEQNVRETLEIADRAYVLQTGRVVLEGTGEELLESELVRKAYLGV